MIIAAEAMFSALIEIYSEVVISSPNLVQNLVNGRQRRLSEPLQPHWRCWLVLRNAEYDGPFQAMTKSGKQRKRDAKRALRGWFEANVHRFQLYFFLIS